MLEQGADPNWLDNKNLTAFDHASASKFIAVCLILKSTNSITPLLNKISATIEKFQRENHPSKTCQDILDIALTTLNKQAIEKYEAAKLLDLYFTINSVLNIIISAQQDDELKAKIQVFFAARENVLRGDSHDYCHTTSLANEFCCLLAEYCYSEELQSEIFSPANILLKIATTQNRAQPWQDIIFLDEKLPDSPGDYFRTASNEIHTYETVITRAIGQLKAGYSKLDDIWLAADNKCLKMVRKGQDELKNVPLTKTDLAILKQRTPTFKTLVTYTEWLYANIDNNGLLERFSELRKGLLRGDAYRGSGTSTHAAKDAFEAVAIFGEWWNSLGFTPFGRDIQTEIRAIQVDHITMGAILDIILDAGNADQRDNGRYCIGEKGIMLERVLASPEARAKFYAIDKKIDWRVDANQLDVWSARILEELRVAPSITTDKNIFYFLYKSISNLSNNTKIDHFDYEMLSEMPVLGHIKFSNDYPYSKLEQKTILDEVFTMARIDHLYLLFVSAISSKADKNYWLYAATVLQIYFLHSKSYISKAEFKKYFDELPKSVFDSMQAVNEIIDYLFSHNKCIELVTCLLLLGVEKIPKQGASLWQKAFQSNHVESAVMLANQFGMSESDWTILQTATESSLNKSSVSISKEVGPKVTTRRWQFIHAFFSAVDIKKINGDKLSALLHSAIAENSLRALEPILRSITITPEHLQSAFNANSGSMVWLLMDAGGEKLLHPEAVLMAASQSQWQTIRAYLQVRNSDKDLLVKLLCHAVEQEKQDEIMEMLRLGAKPTTWTTPTLPPAESATKNDSPPIEKVNPIQYALRKKNVDRAFMLALHPNSNPFAVTAALDPANPDANAQFIKKYLPEIQEKKSLLDKLLQYAIEAQQWLVKDLLELRIMVTAQHVEAAYRHKLRGKGFLLLMGLCLVDLCYPIEIREALRSCCKEDWFVLIENLNKQQLPDEAAVEKLFASAIENVQGLVQGNSYFGFKWHTKKSIFLQQLLARVIKTHHHLVAPILTCGVEVTAGHIRAALKLQDLPPDILSALLKANPTVRNDAALLHLAKQHQLLGERNYLCLITYLNLRLPNIAILKELWLVFWNNRNREAALSVVTRGGAEIVNQELFLSAKTYDDWDFVYDHLSLLENQLTDLDREAAKWQPKQISPPCLEKLLKQVIDIYHEFDPEFLCAIAQYSHITTDHIHAAFKQESARALIDLLHVDQQIECTEGLLMVAADNKLEMVAAYLEARILDNATLKLVLRRALISGSVESAVCVLKKFDAEQAEKVLYDYGYPVEPLNSALRKTKEIYRQDYYNTKKMHAIFINFVQAITSGLSEKSQASRKGEVLIRIFNDEALQKNADEYYRWGAPPVFTDRESIEIALRNVITCALQQDRFSFFTTTNSGARVVKLLQHPKYRIFSDIIAYRVECSQIRYKDLRVFSAGHVGENYFAAKHAEATYEAMDEISSDITSLALLGRR